MLKSKKMHKPSTVFKYCKAEIIGLTNLKNQVLYMASPNKLNDPYDCSLEITVKELSLQEIEKIKALYSSRTDLPEVIRTEFKNKNTGEMKTILEKSIAYEVLKRRKDFARESGVSCFSETKHNLLMWAHYADSFKGYCLEFNTHIEPFSKLRKVEYSGSIPKFDIYDFVVNNNDYQVLRSYFLKSKEWEYEKEWRLIHANAGTEYGYEPEALKAIYLGPRMSNTTKEIICLIIQNQNPSVEIYNATLDKNAFAISFTKIQYIPHIEAKRRGLK